MSKKTMGQMTNAEWVEYVSDFKSKAQGQPVEQKSLRKLAKIFNRTLTRLEAADKRIKELEDLAETVQLSCNPPDDCVDVEVLNTHMLACYAKAVEVGK